MIGRLKQWCHMTFLVSLSVKSRNILFLPRKIIAILRKITINLKQVSLKVVLLAALFSAKSFESTYEKVESL